MRLIKSAVRVVSTGVVLGSLVAGCGQGQGDESMSDLDWTQSRSTTTQYAYLEPNDLTDEFILGASVIKVDNFISNALNMVVIPTNVKLSKSGTGANRKLNVKTAADGETLLSFELGTHEGRDEINFASAGNDLTLRSLIAQVGGIFTAEDQNGFWVSTGAPRVEQIQQDDDTLVVDLVHTVRQAITRTNIFGQTVIDHFVSAEPGDVTVRLFLKRKSSLPSLGNSRTLADATANNIGYFGTSLSNDAPDSKIQRFAIGDATDAQQTLTFYLKDVPAAFNDVARQAILSWNAAFDGQPIKVAAAPEWMDAGDPRYNVVKWFDGLDDDVRWAGVAKMIVEPDTGLVMGGNLYLNGGSVLEMYKGITAHSQAVAQEGIGRVTGSIGNVQFDRVEGEAPVIPFLSDVTQDYDSYMQGYYLETIAHEVGHVLGLRHNFRGTTQLTDNQSASVMDYAPRAERAHYAGPGAYDIAAIQWGYYGVVPAETLAFCTDDHIWTYYDCSQGDWGDAVDSAVHGLLDGTLLMTKSSVAVMDDVHISSMAGALENALKIKKLQAQLPASIRAKVVKKIDAARDYLYSATPAAGLNAATLATVKANLVKMRDLAKKKEAELEAAGNL
jgi:hypothetical protein